MKSCLTFILYFVFPARKLNFTKYVNKSVNITTLILSESTVESFSGEWIQNLK